MSAILTSCGKCVHEGICTIENDMMKLAIEGPINDNLFIYIGCMKFMDKTKKLSSLPKTNETLKANLDDQDNLLIVTNKQERE